MSGAATTPASSHDDTVTMPGFWLGHARYGFYGHKHFFVADMHITENDTVVPITATLTGVVVRDG